MSEFNPYSVYSVISNVKSSNEQELKKVLELAEKFKGLDNEQAARNFLKEHWNIVDYIQEYKLAEDCLLNVQDTKYLFRVNFQYGNENVTYCYKKGGQNAWY